METGNKVKSWNLREEDLVLKDNWVPIHDLRSKFIPNWMGAYIIKSIWSGGIVILMDLDGLEISQPINMDKSKKFYLWEARFAENPEGWPKQS